MLDKVLFTMICLILPVAWGVVVNRVFDLWHERAAQASTDEPVFPDYQI